MAIDQVVLADDGTELHYRVRGQGTAKIALAHSLAMTGSFWDRVVDALGDDVSVLTWDCRGHGASGKPRGPYTVEQFGDDLASIFRDAGWEKAICAGASMGGTVTLAFASRHPAMVSALGLFDTTAFYGPEAPAAWEGRAQKAKDEGLAALVAFQTSRWFSEAFTAANPEILHEAVRIFCANDVAAYGETCRMLGRANLLAQLPDIRVPAAILVGEEDYATPPAMAEQMHGLIAGATLEVIPAARHLTPLECPDLIAERLLQLAERVGK